MAELKTYEITVKGSEKIHVEAERHRYESGSLVLYEGIREVAGFNDVQSWRALGEDAKLSTREHVYRGTIVALAKAIYNGECWDKQTVAAQLHMGDPALDYAYSGEPPEELTDEDVFAALDEMFERAGI